MVQWVFEKCCTVKSQSLVEVIRSARLGDAALPRVPSSTLVQASDKFVRAFSEQLIVQYCALNETVANKQ